MVIAVDFDGTCVTHAYPGVGEDIGAVEVLKDLWKAGHQLILFTMRADTEEAMQLSAAVEWFKDNEIELYGIQINPEQEEWTTSPKAYAELYIDDAALGCPLKVDPQISSLPFVDWYKSRLMLIAKGILKG